MLIKKISNVGYNVVYLEMINIKKKKLLQNNKTITQINMKLLKFK
jgi:hypothetical protein